MAGAGYKLFNTGDVLTAAQVNTYLMEQTVMVFADAAARTTALTGVVSEGMISYLKDTNAVEVYNGSAWVASDDPNAIQNTIVDAKGDLITATAADTPARLAVGNNGETLVADSSATTGLRWQGNFAAGKNAIINGDFNVNQRGTTSTTTSGTFLVDRTYFINIGGTCTGSVQSFTLGTAPVAGYEAKQFLRLVTSGQSGAGDLTILQQQIESVRTFAGQTVTISFWAKAASGTPKITAELSQLFGTGGSPSSDVNTTAGTATISTSWQRYSFTVAVPSISGKTLGTNNNDCLTLRLWVSAGSNFNARTNSMGLQAATFDFWGVQVESGSTATAFQTATGTFQGELAACQRYYFRSTTNDLYASYGMGFCASATLASIQVNYPVSMRALPTAVDYSTLALFDQAGSYTVTNIALQNSSLNGQALQATAAGMTTGRVARLANNNSTAGYLGFSAEL